MNGLQYYLLGVVIYLSTSTTAFHTMLGFVLCRPPAILSDALRGGIVSVMDSGVLSDVRASMVNSSSWSRPPMLPPTFISICITQVAVSGINFPIRFVCLVLITQLERAASFIWRQSVHHGWLSSAAVTASLGVTSRLITLAYSQQHGLLPDSQHCQCPSLPSHTHILTVLAGFHCVYFSTLFILPPRLLGVCVCVCVCVWICVFVCDRDNLKMCRRILTKFSAGGVCD